MRCPDVLHLSLYILLLDESHVVKWFIVNDDFPPVFGLFGMTLVVCNSLSFARVYAHMVYVEHLPVITAFRYRYGMLLSHRTRLT